MGTETVKKNLETDNRVVTQYYAHGKFIFWYIIYAGHAETFKLAGREGTNRELIEDEKETNRNN